MKRGHEFVQEKERINGRVSVEKREERSGNKILKKETNTKI